MSSHNKELMAIYKSALMWCGRTRADVYVLFTLHLSLCLTHLCTYHCWKRWMSAVVTPEPPTWDCYYIRLIPLRGGRTVWACGAGLPGGSHGNQFDMLLDSKEILGLNFNTADQRRSGWRSHVLSAFVWVSLKPKDKHVRLLPLTKTLSRGSRVE